MREMNQGEEYSEDEYTGEEYDESEEEVSAKISTIFGIPKLYFLIGVAVLVVVVLLLVLFLFRGSSNKEDELTEVDDFLSSTEVDQDESDDDSYDWSPEDDASTDTESEYSEDDGQNMYAGSIKLYDATGNLIGTCNDTSNGSEIYDLYSTIVGVFDDNGTVQAYDENGNSIGNYRIYDDSETLDNDYINNDLTDTGETNVLSADELHYQMRAYGYTADEIDMAVQMGVTLQQLEDEAKAAQDVKAVEALKRMSDHGSKEFKRMKKYSIFAMPRVTFDNVKASSLRDDYDASYIVNADYEKCPTYGLQLFIKVKVANKTYAFMSVTPERWRSLPDTGNIVVQVSMRVYGSKHVNTYITDIVEVDTTHNTVNAKDSGSSIKQILKDANALPAGDVTEVEDDTSAEIGGEW